MRDIACSGYTINASELTKVLPKDIRDDYKRFIAKKDLESVRLLLFDYLPDEFPMFEDVFIHGDDDDDDAGELEHGEMYVLFEETDLYTKTPTPELQAMEKEKIVPKFVRWTVWG